MTISTRSRFVFAFGLALVAFLLFPSESSQKPQRSEDSPAGMVLIPGGKFLMGSEKKGDHSPAHEVRVDSFYIDKFEVTNAQYLEFCRETDRKMPAFWGIDRFRSGTDFPDHPVMGVSCYDAAAYAEWCGKRLPTEAEWEYAARGGLVGMDYPNGNTLDSTMANHAKSGAEGPVPVGSYPPNGFGLHDMAGNVAEWVSDYYDGDYYAESPTENPTGPEDGKFLVIRGGGWHSGPSCNRVYFRNGLRGSWVDFNIGFRCVKDTK